MSRTVLSVAYPFAPVSTDAVGGAEQVLAMLDRALVEAGHQSLVIAAEGSRVSGELIALPPSPDCIDAAARERMHAFVRQRIAQTLAARKVDVVHLHGIDFAAYLPTEDLPVLVTLHLPLGWYPPDVFALPRRRTYLHCVSESQQSTAPPGARLLPPILNGVDLDHFRPRGRAKHYAILLARICPEKGIHFALQACRSAGVPLLLGGQVYPYPIHQDYFHREVEPLLDNCRRFVGPLGRDRKAALLAKAKCLLAPSMVAETSSLVVMEALACGTPVIAFPAGALSELIADGETGFLAHSAQEMAVAIGRIDKVSREKCRLEALGRFSARNSVRGYFRAYAAVSEL